MPNILENLDKWDRRFLELTNFIKDWSKDPRTKVGCVLVGDGRRVLSLGYNGFPRGFEDTEERLNDRQLKNLYMAHSERNAIDNTNESLVGATAYVSYFPCNDCAKALIQKGIKRVVSPMWSEDSLWKDSFKISMELLEECGVQVDIFPEHLLENNND